MAVLTPATPVIRGAKAVYTPNEQVTLTWTSGFDTNASEVKIYADGVYVSTQSAMGTTGVIGTTWTWSATAGSLAPTGSTVTIRATVSNSYGTSAPASVTFDIYESPIVTLVPAQDATITGLPLTVSWSVDDPTGVSRQTMRIFSTSSVVYATDYTPELELETYERSRTLFAADLLMPMESGTPYKVRITVTNGVGLSTTVTHDIDVSWVAPTMPTFTNTEADPETASITVRAQAASPSCDVVVWRVVDGNRVVVGEGGDYVEFVDVMPPLGIDVTYEAVATDTETGAVSDVNTRTVRVQTSAWVINYGAAAEEMVQLRYNPSASYSIEHGGEMYHFADGGAGGGYPVWYGTTDRDESGSISWQTANRSLADRLHDLSLKHPYGWIRDPYGHRWYAYIRPSMSHDRTRVCKVSIDWDKMRWREP